MSSLLVSPAEPSWLRRALAARFEVVLNAIPERHGVDIAWRGPGGWWGVQRKQIDDLIASLHDGRLQREVAQMCADNGVTMPHIIIEGKVKFTVEGTLMRDAWGKEVTRQQWQGIVWSLQRSGVAITYAPAQQDAVEAIAALYDWSRKAKHQSLHGRPGPAPGAWGTRDSKAWQMHLLQGFDGIGPEVARGIIDHFGRVPLRWDVEEREMLQVKGLGKKRVETLRKALQ